MGGLWKSATVLGRRWNDLSVQDGGEKENWDEKHPGEHLCPRAKTGILPKDSSVRSAVVLNPGFRITLTQLVSYYLSWVIPVGRTEASNTAAKCLQNAENVVCMNAQLGRYGSTRVRKRARNLQQADPWRPSATALSVCAFCPLLPFCAPKPKADADVLAETCTSKACRADQKPTSHSQFSLLIMACAVRVNHIVVSRIYLYLFLKFHKDFFTRLANSKHLVKAFGSIRLNNWNEEPLLEEVGDLVTAGPG